MCLNSIHNPEMNQNPTFFFLNLCLRFKLASLWSEQTAQCVCVVEYAASQWCVSAVCCGAVDLLCLQCPVIQNYPLHQLCSTRLLFGIQTTAPGLRLYPPVPCVSREIISPILSLYSFVSLYIPSLFCWFVFTNMAVDKQQPIVPCKTVLTDQLDVQWCYGRSLAKKLTLVRLNLWFHLFQCNLLRSSYPRQTVPLQFLADSTFFWFQQVFLQILI